MLLLAPGLSIRGLVVPHTAECASGKYQHTEPILKCTIVGLPEVLFYDIRHNHIHLYHDAMETRGSEWLPRVLPKLPSFPLPKIVPKKKVE